MDSGFSPSVIWGTTRRYKPVEGVLVWLDHKIRRMAEMTLFAEKMLSVGQEVQDSTSAGLRQKAFFWFVVAEGYFASHEPAMTVATRRVFDSFSTDIRCSFVRFSLVPRSVLDRSSID